MRFVAVKTEAQQASAIAYRTQNGLVGQPTQTINALRGHLAERGLVAPPEPRMSDALRRSRGSSSHCDASGEGGMPDA